MIPPRKSMLPTCRYFISILLCLCVSFTSWAQKAKESKTPPAKETKKPVVKDTVKNKYVPHGIRIGTDVISILKSNRATKTFNGWEVNVDTDLSRYYFTVDYGMWARTLAINNGDYQNSGHYFRIGTDVNFMLKDKDRNMFFMGVRYGHSSFSETLQYTSTVPNFGSIPSTLSNPNVKGSWAEITTGLRVKIWKGLWMGYTARLKLAPNAKGNGTMKPFDMPGYGLVGQSSYWGFNYQVFWRFGWKKWPAIPVKKDKE